MKHKIKFLAMLMMAMMCSITVACSKDDEPGNGGGKDDEPGNGGGKNAAKVDGTSYTLNYGWYLPRGNDLMLGFSNVDVNNLKSSNNRIQFLTFNLDGGIDDGEIIPGNYTAYMEFEDMTCDPSTESYNTGDLAYGTVEIIISKNGSKYTISVPETIVTKFNVNTNRIEGNIEFSFNYNGKLSLSEFED